MRRRGYRSAAAMTANIRNVCLSLNLETTALPPQPPVLDHYNIIAAAAARPSETVKNSRTAVSGTPRYDYTAGGGGGGGGVMGKTRARCNGDIL